MNEARHVLNRGSRLGTAWILAVVVLAAVLVPAGASRSRESGADAGVIAFSLTLSGSSAYAMDANGDAQR